MLDLFLRRTRSEHLAISADRAFQVLGIVLFGFASDNALFGAEGAGLGEGLDGGAEGVDALMLLLLAAKGED